MTKDIIRAAQARAGYGRDTRRMCEMAMIPLSTFTRKLRTDSFTIAELRRIGKVVKFTDGEIVEMIRGRTK